MNINQFLLICLVQVQLQRQCPFRGRNLRDLSSAPHRHSSAWQPLSRMVVFLEAMLSTAHVIATTKTDIPKQRAEAFLRTITSEDVLLLALLSDAAQEASHVLRFYDGNQIDVIGIQRVMAEYLSRLDYLRFA